MVSVCIELWSKGRLEWGAECMGNYIFVTSSNDAGGMQVQNYIINAFFECFPVVSAMSRGLNEARE